jgi:hypothetical protein
MKTNRKNHLEKVFSYHVDNAKVVDANALEMEITKQFR